jgi:hypothetical protein
MLHRPASRIDGATSVIFIFGDFDFRARLIALFGGGSRARPEWRGGAAAPIAEGTQFISLQFEEGGLAAAISTKAQTGSIGGGCHRLPVSVSGGGGPSLAIVEGRCGTQCGTGSPDSGLLPAIPGHFCHAYGAIQRHWRPELADQGARLRFEIVAMVWRRAGLRFPYYQ